MFVLCLVTSSGKLWNYIQKPIITYQFTYQIRLCCWSTRSPKRKKKQENKNFSLSPLSPQRFIVGCLGRVHLQVTLSSYWTPGWASRRPFSSTWCLPYPATLAWSSASCWEAALRPTSSLPLQEGCSFTSAWLIWYVTFLRPLNLAHVETPTRKQIAEKCPVWICCWCFARDSKTLRLLSPQFPEMDAIAQVEKRTSSKAIFFLIQNAGLLSGFTIILMITMFAGQINLGEWVEQLPSPRSA